MTTPSARTDEFPRSQNAPRPPFAGLSLECEAAAPLFEARRMVVREAIEGFFVVWSNCCHQRRPTN
jgi:hypothetical protein